MKSITLSHNHCQVWCLWTVPAHGTKAQHYCLASRSDCTVLTFLRLLHKFDDILHCFFYLVQQKSRSQDVAAIEQISSVAYHSWSRKRKHRRRYHQQPCPRCKTATDTDATVAPTLTHCVSVRSSSALWDMCSRNRFFWREWSLTRQFSARSSDTGEWSITVNLPPLEATESTTKKWDGGYEGGRDDTARGAWRCLFMELTLFVVKVASSHWKGANKYFSLCPSERNPLIRWRALLAPTSGIDWSKEESVKHTSRKQEKKTWWDQCILTTEMVFWQNDLDLQSTSCFLERSVTSYDQWHVCAVCRLTCMFVSLRWQQELLHKHCQQASQSCIHSPFFSLKSLNEWNDS